VCDAKHIGPRPSTVIVAVQYVPRISLRLPGSLIVCRLTIITHPDLILQRDPGVSCSEGAGGGNTAVEREGAVTVGWVSIVSLFDDASMVLQRIQTIHPRQDY